LNEAVENSGQRPAKRKIKRGFSKNLGFSIENEEKGKTVSDDLYSYMQGKEDIADPINKEKLDTLVKDFIEKLDNQPSLQSVLRAEKFELAEDFNIEFKFYNQMQQNEFARHLEMLQKELRTQLNNYKIRIKTTVLTQDMPFSTGPNEKFERMASKNPNLLKLKNSLKLEIDF
jgi:hypothetical protein